MKNILLTLLTFLTIDTFAQQSETLYTDLDRMTIVIGEDVQETIVRKPTILSDMTISPRSYGHEPIHTKPVFKVGCVMMVTGGALLGTALLLSHTNSVTPQVSGTIAGMSSLGFIFGTVFILESF
jgi:hypothetical protein